MKNFLTKEYMGMKFYFFIPLFLIGLVGLIVGSFMDLQISTNMANINSGFGRFFETWGAFLPCFICPLGLGIASKPIIKKGGKPWAIALAAFISIAAIAGVSYLNIKDMSGSATTSGYGYTLPKVAAIIIVIIFNLGMYAVGYFFANEELGFKKLLTIGLVIVLAFGLLHLFTNVFKIMANRPRYRFLAWENNGYSIDNFAPWYKWAFGKKLATSNSDSLKSFPSGHTGSMAIVCLLPTAFLAFKRTSESKLAKYLGYCIPFVFVIVMGFARIVNGAHFLSDVSFATILGCLISLLCAYVGQIILDKYDSKPSLEDEIKSI